MENGERLAALAAVRDFEHRLLSARASRSVSASLTALQAAISRAGRQCMPQVRSIGIAPLSPRANDFLCVDPYSVDLEFYFQRTVLLMWLCALRSFRRPSRGALSGRYSMHTRASARPPSSRRLPACVRSSRARLRLRLPQMHTKPC